MKSVDEVRSVWAIATGALGFIGGIFGSGLIIQKYKSKIDKLSAAVLDSETEAPKVISVAQCQRQMENCIGERRDRRAEDRDNLARELQNIHQAVADQGKDLATMQKSVSEIVGILKTGVLKEH